MIAGVEITCAFFGLCLLAQDFFAPMIVDAVLSLGEELDIEMVCLCLCLCARVSEALPLDVCVHRVV